MKGKMQEFFSHPAILALGTVTGMAIIYMVIMFLGMWLFKHAIAGVMFPVAVGILVLILWAVWDVFLKTPVQTKWRKARGKDV